MIKEIITSTIKLILTIAKGSIEIYNSLSLFRPEKLFFIMLGIPIGLVSAITILLKVAKFIIKN